MYTNDIKWAVLFHKRRGWKYICVVSRVVLFHCNFPWSSTTLPYWTSARQRGCNSAVLQFRSRAGPNWSPKTRVFRPIREIPTAADSSGDKNPLKCPRFFCLTFTLGSTCTQTNTQFSLGVLVWTSKYWKQFYNYVNRKCVVWKTTRVMFTLSSLIFFLTFERATWLREKLTVKIHSKPTPELRNRSSFSESHQVRTN